jgi:Rap1a immunity proteins
MNAKPLVFVTVVTASMLLLPKHELGATITLDGNNLYTDCTAATTKVPTEQWSLVGTCIGYVTAVTDAMFAGNSVNGFKACIPVNVDMNQIVDVVKNFIRDNPEKRHLVAVGLVAAALARAFPCRPTKQPN